MEHTRGKVNLQKKSENPRGKRSIRRWDDNIKLTLKKYIAIKLIGSGFNDMRFCLQKCTFESRKSRTFLVYLYTINCSRKTTHHAVSMKWMLNVRKIIIMIWWQKTLWGYCKEL